MNPPPAVTIPRELGILFAGAAVRALVAGRKSQTRRHIQWPKPRDGVQPCDLSELMFFRTSPRAEVVTRSYDRVTCPYAVGDRLWVRETYAIEHSVESDQAPPFDDGRPLRRRSVDAEYEDPVPEWRQAHYRATDPAPELSYEVGPDEPRVRWKASIHMPKSWARIWLEVTEVRVELLNNVTEADCIAEGIEPFHGAYTFNGGLHLSDTPTQSFAAQWQALYGPETWEQNPWLWVIDFRRIAAPT